MKTLPKIITILALAGAIGAVLVLKKNEPQKPTDSTIVNVNPSDLPSGNKNAQTTAKTPIEPVPESITAPVRTLKLVDLGADKCIPCKMMAPILEDMKAEYKDSLEVIFIDIWKNPQEAKKYRITSIPTQIFYDYDGKELYRHRGFFAKEAILNKWKELGFDITKGD